MNDYKGAIKDKEDDRDYILEALGTSQITDKEWSDGYDIEQIINHQIKPVKNQNQSYSCFIRGTKVLMEDLSYKNIEEIQIGDYVITHLGNKKKVTEIKKRLWQGNIYEIKGYGLLPIKCSPEHPFLVNGREWINAKDLKEGMKLTIPKTFNIVKDKLDYEFEQEDEFLWVLGLFLAEGSFCDYHLQFSLHRKETDYRDRISKFFNQFGANVTTTYKKGTDSMSVMVFGKKWVNLFREYAGEYCDKKKLNKKFLTLEPKKQFNILKGWMDGDGCYTKEIVYIGVTTSKNLVRQMFDIAKRNNIRIAIRKRKYREDRKDAWELQFSRSEVDKFENKKSIKRNNSYFSEDKNNFYIKIHKINIEHCYTGGRCDFNVSLNSKGKIVDDIRITQAMPTIKHLVNKKAKVILISHMGRPKNKKSFQKEGVFASLKDVIFKEDRKYTLKPVFKELKKHLEDVQFINDCIGKRVDRKVNSLKPGQVLLLENLRYYEDEEKNGDYFTRRLADLGDLYVNNAFSASHRDHASISGLPQKLPSYPGFLFEREVRVLSKLKKDVKRPLVVIVGGAKMSSKIKTIGYFMDHADHILLGGKVANGVLAIRGLVTNIDLPSEDVVKKLEAIPLTSQKLKLPVDVVASSDPDGYLRHTGPGKVRTEETIYDIGPETVNLFSEIIREANTIVWGGPLGFFEKDNFATGTKKIAQKVVQNDSALKITGGGDTSFALKKFGLRDYIDHVSLGGGAMLTFLSDEEFPGLNGLK